MPTRSSVISAYLPIHTQPERRGSDVITRMSLGNIVKPIRLSYLIRDSGLFIDCVAAISVLVNNISLLGK